MRALQDDLINEIMLNPDGQLWVEHVKNGMYPVGEMNHGHAVNFIRTVAGLHGLVVQENHPILETELPLDLSRFEATIPPVTRNASFTIRKKAKKIYSLDEYVESGILNAEQAEMIRAAIVSRKNILVCGGPGTGKTTFTNACIAELVKLCDPNQRIIILEDVPELQCAAKNTLSMCTSKNVDLSDLLRVTLRSRPDRILVGEVRNKAMLDLLKAWNTGSPGGIATVHANGVDAAIQRCSDLAQEAGVPSPDHLILETVNIIVAIERCVGGAGRVVKEDAELTGFSKENGFIFNKMR